MDTQTVVRHWPFIEKKLNFHRWESGRRAMGLLARLQHEAGGEFAELGPKRLRELGMTAGETGGIWRTLVDLEARRVVSRRRGAGRLPDSWGLRPDISHWRSMPWKAGGLRVEQSIAGCSFCFANFAVASRNPGQARLLHLVTHEFSIGADDHLPEILGISRSYGDLRAAKAKSPAWDHVDSRGHGGEISPIRASVNSSKELTVLNSEEEQVLRVLKEAGEARTGQTLRVPCQPYERLVRLVRRLNLDQAEKIASKTKRIQGHTYIPKVFELMEDFAVERDVKELARSEGWTDDGPAGFESAWAE